MERAFASETDRLVRKPRNAYWAVGFLSLVCLALIGWLVVLEIRLSKISQHLERIDKLSQFDQGSFELIDESNRNQNKQINLLDQVQKAMRVQIDTLYQEVKALRAKSE